MHDLLKRLWQDDQGALIATEYLFIATILIIGIIVGLTSLREAVVTELAEMGNAILALSQGFVISGQSGPGGMTDGSQAIDTPGGPLDPTLTPPAIPSLVDVVPGN